MQSGMNIIYTGLFFKGNPAAKAWDQVVLGPVDVTIEPQTGKWILVAYRETEKLFEDVIDDKMKIKLRDNFIQWTMQREGKKEMYGLRIKELAQATKLNEELHTILSSKAPVPSPNERALRIKLSDDEYVSINCKIDSSMMQVMKQLATLKHFDSTQFALSVATPSGGSPQSLRPSSIVRDLGASSVLIMRRRRKTAYEAPKISTDKITEKHKTITNESAAPCIAVEVTFPSSETRSFNVPPSILLPELLSVVCNSAGLRVPGHAFDLPIENISKIKLQQLRLSQLTVIEKEVPESEKSMESTDSGNSKYANIKKPPPPPLSPSSSSRRATVHAQAPPPPSSPGRRATVHAQAPPPPSSPGRRATVHAQVPPPPSSPGRRATVHAQVPPPPSSPSSKRTTSQFVPMQAPPTTTPTIKPLSPTIQAHMRLRSGSSPSTNRDVNDAISSMLTQQAVGKATPTGVSLSPLVIKKSAPAESKSKRAAPPPPGKEDGTSPRIGRQNSPMVQKKATPAQEEVDGGTKSEQVPSYRQHGIPLPSMVKGNKAGGGEAETRNGSMKVSISPTVGRRQKKPVTSLPPPSQPPPPPPTSDNVNASSGTSSHVRKPSRKAPTKPPGNGEPPPDPAPSPASDPAAKIEKPAPDPAVKSVRAAPSNAPIKFKVPPPPPRKKQETVNAKENIEIVKDTRELQEKKEKEKEEEKEEEEEEEEDSEEDETDSDDSSAVAGGYDIQQKDHTSSSASSTTDEDSKRELEELDTSEPVTWQQYKEEEKESEEEKSIDSSDDDDDDDGDDDEEEDNGGIVLITHKQSTTDEPIDLPSPSPPSPPPDPLIQEAVHKLTHFNEDNEEEEEKGEGAVNMSTLNELDNMVASLRLLIADTCEIGGAEVTPTQLTSNHDDKSLDATQVTSMAPPADVPKTPPLPPPTSIHSTETTDAPSQAGPPPPPPPPPPPIGPVEKKRPPPVVKPKPKPKDTQTSRSVPGHGSGDDGMEELKQKLLQRQAKMQREQTSQDTNEEKRGQLKEDTSREPAREISNVTVIREGAGGAAGNDMQAQLNMLQQQMLQQQMMQLQQQFQQLQQQLIAGGGGGGQFNPLLMQQSFPMPPGSMLGQYPMYGVGGATSVTMPTTSVPMLGQGQQQLYPNMPPYTSGAPPFPPSFAMQGVAPVPVPPPIVTVTPPTSLVNPPVSEGEVVKRDRKISEADRRSVALGNQEGQFDNLMEEVRDTKPDQILNKVPENQGGQDLADTDMTAAINKAMEERRPHLSTSSSVDAEKNADDDDDDDEWEENL